MKKFVVIHAPNILGPLAQSVLEQIKNETNVTSLRLGNEHGKAVAADESGHFTILSQEAKGLFAVGKVLLEVVAETSKDGYQVTTINVRAYGSWTYGTEVIESALNKIKILEKADCKILIDYIVREEC